MSQSITECYRVLESVTKCYRVLQSVTECYRVLQSVTECYRVFLAHLLGPISGLVNYDLQAQQDDRLAAYRDFGLGSSSGRTIICYLLIIM